MSVFIHYSIDATKIKNGKRSGWRDKQAKSAKQKIMRFLKKGVDILQTMVYNIKVVGRKSRENKKCCYSSVGRAHPW